MTLVLLAAGVSMALAGCGRASTPQTLRQKPPTTTTPTTGPRPQIYQINAVVLSNATHGPQLCLSVASSLPPQCGGPPIAGWDWSKVTGQTTVNGVTWGGYHLVGTFDGTIFTPTAPPGRPTPTSPTPPPDTSPPCPAPPGGWPLVPTTLNEYNNLLARAQAAPDYAGMWVHQQSAVFDPRRDVLTFAFTGDAVRHRADLTAIWKGPICVVQRPRSEAVLQRIQGEITGAIGQQLGLQIVSVGIDEIKNRVDVEVYLALPTIQRQLDQRYGAGATTLTGALQPVG